MGKYAKQEVYFVGIYENPNPNIRTTSATKFNIIKSKICDLLEDSYKLVDEYINEIKSKYDPSDITVYKDYTTHGYAFAPIKRTSDSKTIFKIITNQVVFDFDKWPNDGSCSIREIFVLSDSLGSFNYKGFFSDGMLCVTDGFCIRNAYKLDKVKSLNDAVRFIIDKPTPDDIGEYYKTVDLSLN